jgi:hypothetical protein
VVLNGSRAYAQAFAYLRYIVQEHIANSIAPLLSELLKLISRYESVKMQSKALLDIMQNNTKFVQMQDN